MNTAQNHFCEKGSHTNIITDSMNQSENESMNMSKHLYVCIYVTHLPKRKPIENLRRTLLDLT